MNERSMSNQAALPDEESVVASQEAQPKTREYSGGNALLDAQAEVQHQPSGKAIADPVATNFSGATERDDPADAQNFTTTGAYPADQTQLDKNYNPPPSMNNQDIADENAPIRLEGDG